MEDNKQIVIRTNEGSAYSNLDNLDNLNSYLSDGWKVVLVNPIGKSLEYVLEKTKKLKK